MAGTPTRFARAWSTPASSRRAAIETSRGPAPALAGDARPAAVAGGQGTGHPTLSVVVPATDRPATLGLVIESIRRAFQGPEEVIVVTTPAHLSAAGARNAGAHRARGDVVVFVDADVEVAPDAFVRMRAAFADDPGLTAVFGSYDQAPAVGGTVSGFRNLLHHHVHQAGGGPAETFWAGLGAISREAFVDVGGFDERFNRPSIEDIELGDRLVSSGARIVLDPAIQGTHHKAWNLRTMVWTDLVLRGVPWVRLQLGSGRVSSALNCGWRHRLSAAACVVAGVSGARRRAGGVMLALGVLLGLNRRFYGLLARYQGRRAAIAGVGLHAVHHLTSVAAAGIGVLGHFAHPGDQRRTVPSASSASSAAADAEVTARSPEVGG